MNLVDFEHLFDSLPSPHMVLDRDYRYVAANRAYQDVVMRKREDLIGRNLFDIFPNEGKGGQRLRASFDRVLQTGEPDTVAYIPYDIPRPEEHGGGIEQRYWTAVHTPLTDSDGNVGFVMQNTVDVTDIVRLREAVSLPFRSGETQLLERAREAEEQHSALIAESEEFRRLFQQAPGFFAVLTGPTHVFAFTNDAYERLIGGRKVIGMAVREALPEIEGQGFLEMLDSVYQTGRPAGGEAMRVMLQLEPGEEPRETYLDFSYDAIRDNEGRITGVFVQGMDRTEAVRTLKRQRLLLDELNHRVKNTLASVQSIATQTLRSAGDLKTAKVDFEARIIALSKVHNLLSAQEWDAAELSVLVEQEVSVYDPERVILSGSRITLKPKASIVMALVVHELSTNAAKYGSLSSASGTLSISWRLDGGRLVFDWIEKGGPVVSPPSRRGFGSRMIKRMITGELAGTYAPDYAAQGFNCRITLPEEEWRREESDLEQ